MRVMFWPSLDAMKIAYPVLRLPVTHAIRVPSGLQRATDVDDRIFGPILPFAEMDRPSESDHGEQVLLR